MINNLCYIAEKLNESKVLWAVGGSILLKHHSLIEKPNDIDILIGEKDILRAELILKQIGKEKEIKSSGSFSTKYFYKYNIRGTDLDVMSGLIINHSSGNFEYTFDESSISDIVEVDGVSIPFASLEDWYILYQLMGNRQEKVDLIKAYFLSHGVKRTDLLKRALEGCIPEKIRKDIEEITA